MNVFTKIYFNDIILPQKLNCPFYYQPHDICKYAVEEVKGVISGMKEWSDEIGQGKMCGVLVVLDNQGCLGYLKAYSGQIGGREDWDGWVPAVFDYLQPDGYFAKTEAEITLLNREIESLESSVRYRVDCARLAKAKEKVESQLRDYRLYMANEKELRKIRRESGEDCSVLERESQFQKAELKRLKQRLEDEMRPLTCAVDSHNAKLLSLKAKRKQMSDDLQQWLFSQFVMVNGKGEKLNLLDIFSNTAQVVPPSGAGECCAPKLLQYALLHEMKPVAMAEFWWGRSPVGEIRHHLSYYPACQGKCKPILDFMLQGLEVESFALDDDEKVQRLRVLYEDECLIAVDKPSGMLSVPGKGSRLSAVDVLSGQRQGVVFYPVHRLDMQTSGILLFAKSEDVLRAMQKLFATRGVKKMYRAILDGVFNGPSSGTVDLPLSPDYLNRPCQKVDMENGKPSVTIYNIICTRNGQTEIELFPQTGRTHQLRVHCAHHDGLGIPIVGDDLYGVHSVRLMLHAETLDFVHPVTGENVHIVSNCPF